MTQAELEIIYESLACKIDEVGEHSELFLAKLVLLLAKHNDDADRVRQFIDCAAASLD